MYFRTKFVGEKSGIAMWIHEYKLRNDGGYMKMERYLRFLLWGKRFL